MPLTRQVAVVVPTLGASPLLGECLARFRRDSGRVRPELVVVDQRARPEPVEGADRVIRPGRNLGFAGAVNLGLDATSGDLAAVVNDDLLPEPGWLSALVAALDRHARAGAAQGLNLRLDDPGTVDGCGIAFNRVWRPVQIGQGAERPGETVGTREVFGCSATAVVYRRAALREVSLPGGGVFDDRLVSYYEDVELAGRLRAAGWTGLVDFAAQALHAGSLTSKRMPFERHKLHFANRYLVLARVLGRSLWPRLPLLVGRDLVEIAAGGASGSVGAVAAALAGWGRAVRLLPGFGPLRAARIPPRELRRFRVARASSWPWPGIRRGDPGRDAPFTP